ncbi:uncharacterized protein LOC116415916 [Nasonia vitripennis]|uniref:SET domain-containing protein n=1 Tax=Nasonia vitripennis TaxID=7425 RepID=A0A7M7PXU9_NASVI|nr:uncharacterized protein LOC116415916 [Nasonia vitripennis]
MEKEKPTKSSALASYDDLAKAIIIDTCVGYKTRKYKTYSNLTRSIKWEIISIIEEFKRDEKVKTTTTKLIDFCKSKKLFDKFSLNSQSTKANGIFSAYLTFLKSPDVELARCNRYTMDLGCGSKVIAARDLRQNQNLDILGLISTISETEEEILTKQNANFSIMISERSKKRVLLLFIGPASLLNHDCDPNCKYESLSTNSLRIRTLRKIKKGEELFAFYGQNYFNQKNSKCECHTCEVNKQGAFSIKDDKQLKLEGLNSDSSIIDFGFDPFSSTDKKDENLTIEAEFKVDPSFTNGKTHSTIVSNESIEEEDFVGFSSHSTHLIKAMSLPRVRIERLILPKSKSFYLASTKKRGKSSGFDETMDEVPSFSTIISSDKTEKSSGLNKTMNEVPSFSTIISSTQLELSDSLTNRDDLNKDSIIRHTLPVVPLEVPRKVKPQEKQRDEQKTDAGSVVLKTSKKPKSKTKQATFEDEELRTKSGTLTRPVSDRKPIHSQSKENLILVESNRICASKIEIEKENEKRATSANPAEPKSILRSKRYRKLQPPDDKTAEIDFDDDESSLKAPKSADGKKRKGVCFCIFCRKKQTQFPRHLELKHNTNKHIEMWMNTTDAERKRAILSYYRNVGFSQWEKVTNIIRPIKATREGKITKKVKCKFCEARFSKETLNRHERGCEAIHKMMPKSFKIYRK